MGIQRTDMNAAVHLPNGCWVMDARERGRRGGGGDKEERWAAGIRTTFYWYRGRSSHFEEKLHLNLITHSYTHTILYPPPHTHIHTHTHTHTHTYTHTHTH